MIVTQSLLLPMANPDLKHSSEVAPASLAVARIKVFDGWKLAARYNKKNV